MIDFSQIVRDRRPNLRDTSVNSYALSLRAIAPEAAADLDFLKDTGAVLSRLEYKPTTRKNHLNAAVVVLQGLGDDEFKSAAKVYEARRDKYQEQYLDQTKARKKTASQEKNWVEWPAYEAMVDSMRGDVRWRGAMTPGQAMKFQDYLVALLHETFPVRNDFANLKVVSRRAWNNMTDEGKGERNYVLVGSGGHPYRFIFNHYKTSAKYGRRELKVERPQLTKAIRRWLAHRAGEDFLVNRKGAALNGNGITKILGRVGQRELGRTLGSSLLRHSYLSHKYQGVNEEKEKDADMMMHSVATQNDYIKTSENDDNE